MTKGFDKSVVDGMLAKLSQPSCEERELEIPPDIVARKAEAMAKRGYRHNAQSIEALRLYLAGYGLFLQGPVGTGKTLFFRKLRTFTNEEVAIFSMHDILGRGEVEIREAMDELLGRELLLDDIGAEPTFNNYGVKFDILAYLIDRRMESSERTHFTTNLTKAEIAQRYGGRVIDRIAEMCRSVRFEGKSKRSPKPNWRDYRTMDFILSERAKSGGAASSVPKVSPQPSPTDGAAD